MFCNQFVVQFVCPIDQNDQPEGWVLEHKHGFPWVRCASAHVFMNSRQDTVVGIVTRHGLEDSGIVIRFFAGVRGFFFIFPKNLHIGFGAHSACYSLGHGWVHGSFPRGKSAGSWSWPLSLPGSKVKSEELRHCFPTLPSWRILWLFFLLSML
jgi:hypothetical protein